MRHFTPIVKFDQNYSSNSNDDKIFIVRAMSQCLEEAKLKPVPNCLFSEFWFESEFAILFAGTGLGKTILAVQIANSISKGQSIKGFKNHSSKQKILYFDFELSDKQIENRYSDNYSLHYKFDDNFYRVQINPKTDNDTEEKILSSIEETIIMDNPVHADPLKTDKKLT